MSTGIEIPELEPKDTNSSLDYYIDLKALENGTGTENYLETGETVTVINSVTASPNTITIVSSAIVNTGTTIQVWLSSGVVKTRYKVTANFSTSGVGGTPRIDERSFYVRILDR